MQGDRLVLHHPHIMKIFPTPIAGAYVVESPPVKDSRGSFYRAFCTDELAPLLEGRAICQMNISYTETPGAIRGLHFQTTPYDEMKLVRCLAGHVWDVILDLREESQTFLQWHAEELSPWNAKMMVIPEGCAHGFQVLGDTGSELLYLHTAPYSSFHESGVRYDDPAFGIAWPLALTSISSRDMAFPLLND